MNNLRLHIDEDWVLLAIALSPFIILLGWTILMDRAEPESKPLEPSPAGTYQIGDTVEPTDGNSLEYIRFGPIPTDTVTNWPPCVDDGETMELIFYGEHRLTVEWRALLSSFINECAYYDFNKDVYCTITPIREISKTGRGEIVCDEKDFIK